MTKIKKTLGAVTSESFGNAEKFLTETGCRCVLDIINVPITIWFITVDNLDNITFRRNLTTPNNQVFSSHGLVHINYAKAEKING